MPGGTGDGAEILADLRSRLASSPFHSGLGLVVEDAAAGSVTIAIDVGPEQLNLQGLVHGGLLATVADTAMGLAVRTQVEPGRRHVTIQLGVQYVRAGGPGTIRARGRTIKVGSQVAHAEADVDGEDGRLLARAQGTYSVTAERPA
jgi:uncharacterized protein (TIGR00369 family)